MYIAVAILLISALNGVGRAECECAAYCVAKLQQGKDLERLMLTNKTAACEYDRIVTRCYSIDKDCSGNELMVSIFQEEAALDCLDHSAYDDTFRDDCDVYLSLYHAEVISGNWGGGGGAGGDDGGGGGEDGAGGDDGGVDGSNDPPGPEGTTAMVNDGANGGGVDGKKLMAIGTTTAAAEPLRAHIFLLGLYFAGISFIVH